MLTRLLSAQFLDARYPWCRRYGASRADMDAVVAAFPAAAAASGLPGRAVFLRADLLQARPARARPSSAARVY